MKTKDLFNIILKIFGLLIVKEIIMQLPYILNPIIYMANSEEENAGAVIILFSFLILGLYFALAYTLLFKTNSILRLFKLDEEFFAVDLSLSISKRNILNIGIVIVSGLILIDEIPLLCRYLFNYYEIKQLRLPDLQLPTSDILFSTAKIVIAFLIIGERSRLVDYISKDKDDRQEEEDNMESQTEQDKLTL